MVWAFCYTSSGKVLFQSATFRNMGSGLAVIVRGRLVTGWVSLSCFAMRSILDSVPSSLLSVSLVSMPA